MDSDVSQTTIERSTNAVGAIGSVLLSVVVPVLNQEGSIVENVYEIQRRIAAKIGDDFEMIVVSDGSIDSTEQRLLESELRGVRVFHYDRNLGKGYALKLGSLEAYGRWIGFVDADLDLDPSSLPDYVAIAERDGLDFAIGSKRHPESHVFYPRSRRIASWFFQQLVRVLFRLNVRDTQVGLKVFRRDVAEQVLPFLLVKRFAFDLELLAVGRAFGFGRIREMPIALDYRFAGSGVRSVAVLRALFDTTAVFYRLRILRYYQRRRRMTGRFGWTRPGGFRPRVALACSSDDVAAKLDYPHLDVRLLRGDDGSERRRVAESSQDTIIAFIEPDAIPAANWISATTPFLQRQEIVAVVTSKVAPAIGSIRALAAAAVSESRVGTGSLYYRFAPGNIRFVNDFPATSMVVRRESYLALPRRLPPEEVVRVLAETGRVIYTPETVLVVPPAPLFRPHLARTFAYGRARGRAVRRRGPRALRWSTVLSLAPATYTAVGWLLLARGGLAAEAWVAGWIGYAVVVGASAAIGALRFRSARVGALAVLGLVLTHFVFAAGFVAGVLGASAGDA